MKAVGDKRTRFARVDLPALDRIDHHIAQRDRVGARNMYLTLCQVATIEMDGAHEGFDASRRVLMAKGSVSENTLDKHLAALEMLGLVEVERRVADHRGGLPNRYVLVDSPDPDAPLAADRNACPPASVAGGARNAQPLPPQRARLNAVKNEEEGERERERAHEQTSGQGGELERAVVSEIAQLLADRGEQLTANDRMAIRSVIASSPDGVDPLGAAARVRKHYSPGGKAGERPIVTLAGLLRSEITRSSATSSRVRRTASSARRVPEALPSDLAMPGERLLATWQQMRDGLRRAASETEWTLYLAPLELAGFTTGLVTDLDDNEKPLRTVYLTAAEDKVGWIQSRHTRLIEAVAAGTFGDDVPIRIVGRSEPASARRGVA